MEMPKGWSRISSNDHVYGDVLNALDLMREMAEALEYYSKPVNFRVMINPETEQECVVVDAIHYNKSFEVLKKFKGWK